jgi:hypothetical protein
MLSVRTSHLRGLAGAILIAGLATALVGCGTTAAPTAAPAPVPTSAPIPTATPPPTATPIPSATPTPLPPAAVSKLVFAEGIDDRSQAVGARDDFSPQVKAIYACFDYAGFPKGQLVTLQWLAGGDVRQERTEPWDKATEGSAMSSLAAADGLASGSYEFKILVDKKELASRKCTVSAPPTATPTVTPKPTNTPVPVLVATATPVPPRLSGRIAYTTFTADASRGYEIYVMNADGTGSAKLCTWCSEPSFSPDGAQLVFYSWDRGGLYTTNPAPGGEWKQVIRGGAAWPIWSPNGQLIVLTGSGQKGLLIAVIKPDGTGLQVIADGQQATWSRDSSKLAFKGCVGGDCGLWTVNVDGTGRTRLTTNGNDSSPDWSPDGSKIAFGSNRDGNWEIYSMNPDGSGITRLTNNPTSDGIPVWSPDGKRIAFRSDRSGSWAVYVMDADGSNVTKLVDANVQLSRWDYERLSWTR